MKTNDVFDHLACNLGTESEEPNIKLAAALCESRNEGAIESLIEGLQSSNKALASDCIKVLYEIGKRIPDMIANHVSAFVKLLNSKNNRLVWGGMTALAEITSLNPSEVYAHKDAVIKAVENGSVITRDQGISVFAELSRADKKYERFIFPIILRHLKTCQPKEVARHAERALIAVNEGNAPEFKSVLEKRLGILPEPQRKRVEKILKSV